MNWFRTVVLMYLASATLLCGSAAQAQGYEVIPWPARKPVPALSGNDLQGTTWHLGELRGKAVLINFWASWCEPCRAELPSLDALAQFYGSEKLVVLAVNFKESPAVAMRHAQRAKLGLPILSDTSGQIARAWGTTVFPTTVLVAADGSVRGIVRGELDWTGPQASELVSPLLSGIGPRAKLAKKIEQR